MDGNGLSYLYSVEWPIFAIVSVVVWWMLIHTDYDNVGARAQRKAARRQGRGANETPPMPPRRIDEEDEELAAYNDRLAELAESGRVKTWRQP